MEVWGGVGTATTEETLHLHQRNLLEGSSPINGRSDRKDKDIPKEVTLLFWSFILSHC